MKDSVRHSVAAVVVTVFFTVLLSAFLVSPARAQVQGQFAGVSQCWNGSSFVTVKGNCPQPSGGGARPSAANSAAYNGFYQLGYQFGQWIAGGGSNSQAAEQQRALEQQMMAELARRQAEAERLHQEEEARRLAEMYNRLAYLLKHRELPDLQTKERPGSGPGLQLKLRESTDGQAGIQGLPGIYLNDGKDKDKPYGIPGLPGIYTGGPGQGSGLGSAQASDQGQSGQGPDQTAQPLAIKSRDSEMVAAPAPSPAPAPADATIDPSKMTPQQLADAAEAFSKLPPEEQQRIMTAAQQNAAGSQPTPGVTGQPSTQPLAPLQRQATASQAAAAAPVPEDASARARAGFDQPNAPAGAQPEITGTTPALLRPASPATSISSSPAAPPPAPGMKQLQAHLLVANPPPPDTFPKDPNPPLTNPLAEDRKVQAQLKRWDKWVIERVVEVSRPPQDPLHPVATVTAELNSAAIKQYAPDLLTRYQNDAAFRQSVDLRLKYTNENVALSYYQGLADVHKAAVLKFQAELEKLEAAGKIDRLTPLEDQYRLHPERRQLVQSVQDRVSAEEQAAVAKAQANGNRKLDEEYQSVFQLIRGEAAQSQ